MQAIEELVNHGVVSTRVDNIATREIVYEAISIRQRIKSLRINGPCIDVDAYEILCEVCDCVFCKRAILDIERIVDDRDRIGEYKNVFFDRVIANK